MHVVLAYPQAFRHNSLSKCALQIFETPLLEIHGR